MRIRLKCDIPVNSKHGLVKGKELDVLEEYATGRWGAVRVMGIDGIEVKVWNWEFEIVERVTDD